MRWWHILVGLPLGVLLGLGAHKLIDWWTARVERERAAKAARP